MKGQISLEDLEIWQQVNETSQTDKTDRTDQTSKTDETNRTNQISKYEDLFYRLSRSSFRSRFHLKQVDLQYIQEKGMETIRSHARDFVSKRLAPAVIPNDGKQTPMRGHPVFIAQHATGCCCRGCLYKWHRIPAGTELTKEQQEYVVDVLMEWIRRQTIRM